MSIVSFLFCIVIGTYLLVEGIRYILGWDKAVHFDSFPTSYHAKMGVPLGLFFTCFGIFFLLGFFPQRKEIEAVERLMLLIGISAMVLGNLCLLMPVTRCPMSPKWVKWLEMQHGDIMGLLQYEANKVGLDEWARQVRDRTDLQKWAEEVRQKYVRDGTSMHRAA